MPEVSNVLPFPTCLHRTSECAPASPSESGIEIRTYLKDIIDIAYEGLLTNSESQSFERIASLFNPFHRS